MRIQIGLFVLVFSMISTASFANNVSLKEIKKSVDCAAWVRSQIGTGQEADEHEDRDILAQLLLRLDGSNQKPLSQKEYVYLARFERELMHGGTRLITRVSEDRMDFVVEDTQVAALSSEDLSKITGGKLDAFAAKYQKAMDRYIASFQKLNTAKAKARASSNANPLALGANLAPGLAQMELNQAQDEFATARSEYDELEAENNKIRTTIFESILRQFGLSKAYKNMQAEENARLAQIVKKAAQKQNEILKSTSALQKTAAALVAENNNAIKVNANLGQPTSSQSDPIALEKNIRLAKNMGNLQNAAEKRLLRLQKQVNKAIETMKSNFEGNIGLQLNNIRGNAKTAIATSSTFELEPGEGYLVKKLFNDVYESGDYPRTMVAESLARSLIGEIKSDDANIKESYALAIQHLTEVMQGYATTSAQTYPKIRAEENRMATTRNQENDDFRQAVKEARRDLNKLDSDRILNRLWPRYLDLLNQEPHSDFIARHEIASFIVGNDTRHLEFTMKKLEALSNSKNRPKMPSGLVKKTGLATLLLIGTIFGGGEIGSHYDPAHFDSAQTRVKVIYDGIKQAVQNVLPD